VSLAIHGKAYGHTQLSLCVFAALYRTVSFCRTFTPKSLAVLASWGNTHQLRTPVFERKTARKSIKSAERLTVLWSWRSLPLLYPLSQNSSHSTSCCGGKASLPTFISPLNRVLFCRQTHKSKIPHRLASDSRPGEPFFLSFSTRLAVEWSPFPPQILQPPPPPDIITPEEYYGRLASPIVYLFFFRAPENPFFLILVSSLAPLLTSWPV